MELLLPTDVIDPSSERWGQGVAAGQDTTGNTARDTYICDALDNFKAAHVIIPLLPEA